MVSRPGHGFGDPGEYTSQGAALWGTGARSSRGCAGGHLLGRRLPILPISRTSPGEVGEDPPALQQVSMYGPWLLVQRRRLAKTLEAGAGCGRLATGGCEGRGTFLSRNPEALLAERREGLF